MTMLPDQDRAEHTDMGIDFTWTDYEARYWALRGLTLSKTGLPRPACFVCGTPYEKHGSYPTCASHPYTPDGNCRHVIGSVCGGSECRAGCVRAIGAKEFPNE
jgi:hypothetical protein